MIPRSSARPAGPELADRTLARVIAGAALAFVVLALLVIGRFDPLLDFDAVVSRAAHSVALANPPWRAVMSAITTTGSTTVILPLAVLGCAILLAYRRWRQAVFVAFALTVTLLARLAVVNLIARPRPTERL